MKLSTKSVRSATEGMSLTPKGMKWVAKGIYQPLASHTREKLLSWAYPDGKG